MINLYFIFKKEKLHLKKSQSNFDNATVDLTEKLNKLTYRDTLNCKNCKFNNMLCDSCHVEQNTLSCKNCENKKTGFKMMSLQMTRDTFVEMIK